MSFLSSRLRTSILRNTTSLRSTQQRLFASKTVVVERELPKPPPPSRKRWIWTGAAVGAVVWVVGLGSALNHQRLSSSVVHGTLFMVRYDPRVIALLGDHVDYASSWPWISGTVNHLKGKINISFNVKGDSGQVATVVFNSRRMGGLKWTTDEFTVTRISDKTTIDIGHELTEEGSPIVNTTTV